MEKINACRSRRPGGKRQHKFLELHLQRLHVLQLRISLFNKLFSHLLYLVKMKQLLEIIVSAFFAIKLFKSIPSSAALSAYVAVSDWTVFHLLFRRASELPELMQTYKKDILRLAGVADVDADFRKAVNKFVRSVRELGVSAGGFYYFDSLSMVNFGDFIVNQTISLLLTYRDPIVVNN